MRVPDLLLLRSAVLAAAVTLCCAAHAAPESGDPLLRLLQDKNVASAIEQSGPPSPPVDTPAAKPGFVSQMRDSASGMVVSAMNFLGVKYRRGGSSAEEGFDCSGFTRHVFESSLGLILPRRVDDQASAPGLQKVRRDELQPGDLVFFNTLKRTFSHVGIYVGEGKFIHAPRTGARVRVEDMRFSYWQKRFTGGRRPDNILATSSAPLPQLTAAPAAPSLQAPVISSGPSPSGRSPATGNEPYVFAQ